MKSLLCSLSLLALLFGISVRGDTVTNPEEPDSDAISLQEGNVDSALVEAQAQAQASVVNPCGDLIPHIQFSGGKVTFGGCTTIPVSSVAK